MDRRMTRAGFTLIEILLVLLIIGMLAGVAVMIVPGILESAKIDVTKGKIDKVYGSVETYALKFGYPAEDQGLNALVTKPTFENEELGKDWRGPYLNADDLKDAWDKPLVYKVVDEDSGSGSTRKRKPGVVFRGMLTG